MRALCPPWCQQGFNVSDTSFEMLGLSEPILRALSTEGYQTPTPIQAGAIPLVLAGRDVLGLAQTGTGKTAAFGLPLLQHLAAEKIAVKPREARALILAPTRELALQIFENLRLYSRHLKLSHAVILGGVNQNRQIAALRNGADILVATPGRLLDLIGQKHLRLDHVTHLVIDEADRMFDMGFIRDVRRIVGLLPRKRQSLLFSATMPGEVAHLVNEVLHQPARVEVSPKAIAAPRIAQCVYHVAAGDKRTLLNTLLQDEDMSRVIVFTRTKHGANKIATQLAKSGYKAEAIHGNKSQNARQRALEDFRSGRARVLVATDIAARGIDIDGVTHVVNFDLPEVAESYVHRIGRTARAGAEGVAIALCDPTEQPRLKAIERLLKHPLEVIGASLPPQNAASKERPNSDTAAPRPRARRHRNPRARYGRGRNAA
ncbi:MAG: DEAD/DEAH box helicase [Alphaproteobacteria bacterium]|jgi:ATP-dependent RNA helicase RhlE|nr:DEAD/DEAH box helicase [Alphaproteobacteria bacterium]